MDIVPMAEVAEKRHGLIRSYPMTYTAAYYPAKPPKVYHIEIPKNLYPSGKDPGQEVIKDMVKSYAEQVTTTIIPKQRHVNLQKLSTQFKEASFEEQLESVELEAIPLESAIAIQHFSYPHHSTDAKKFFIHFTKLLKYNDMTLVRARLSGLQITDFILDQLCSGLCRNESVQYLMLNNNKFTDIGVERLCNALRWHPVVRCVWLGGNHITDIGMRQLAILCSRNHNITEINVANKWPNPIWAKQEYDLHPHITHIGIDSLAKSILKGTGLTSISLADQRIRDEGAMMLFEVLQASQLRAINLSKNELTNRCCLTLQEALKDSPILQELNLSNNQIGDAGAIDIAAGLAFNTNLSTLDLSHNVIDMRGLYALYKCLDYNNSLESLLTLGNKTKDDRAENLVVCRSRSVFTFGTSSSLSSSASFMPSSGSMGSTPSSSLSSSMLLERSQSKRISWTPNTLKEVRKSLFMNPSEASASDDERESSLGHVRRSSLIHRSASSNALDSEISPTKRYSSFAEMAKSPFRTEKDNVIAAEIVGDAGNALVGAGVGGKNDAALEIHGKKTRMKSIWLGSSSSASLDDYAIPEGSHQEEYADDSHDAAMKKKVKKMVHAANKAHRGPMNIQDAIKTAVHIVEQLTEEDEQDEDAPHDKSHHIHNDSHGTGSAARKDGEDDHGEGGPRSKDLTDASLSPTKSSVLKPPSAANGNKKKKQVRLRIDGEVDGEPLSIQSSDGLTNDVSEIVTHEGDIAQTGVDKGASSGGEDDIRLPTASSTFSSTLDPLTVSKADSTVNNSSSRKPFSSRGIRPSSAGAVSKENPFTLPAEEMKKFFMEDINPRLKHQPSNTSGKELHNSSSSSKRLSENYGKTLGVPQIKSMGIRPIRTSISNYADSGEHLMYLRVATEDDPEGTRPYSLVKIALDKQAERERIKKERQSRQYKVVRN